MGLSDGRKSFPIGLAVLIQYRRVTDTQPATQPATQPRRCSYYALTLKASSAKSGVGPLKAKSGELIVDDYRPIYLTSCFSKTFERIVKQQILAYMFQQQLIMRQQFGFLSKCSTYIHNCLTALMTGHFQIEIVIVMV